MYTHTHTTDTYTYAHTCTYTQIIHKYKPDNETGTTAFPFRSASSSTQIFARFTALAYSTDDTPKVDARL